MDKILVTLIVPSIGEEFDVLIPGFLKIKEVKALLAEAVSDITQNMYVPSGGEILCRGNPRMILNMECTMMEYEVVHGECLYLF